MVVPPQNGLVDLSVERDRDVLIALANRRRLELGNAVLKIGAAVTEIGRPYRHGRNRTPQQRDAPRDK
jgi:hypothetical protein